MVLDRREVCNLHFENIFSVIMEELERTMTEIRKTGWKNVTEIQIKMMNIETGVVWRSGEKGVHSREMKKGKWTGYFERFIVQVEREEW